MSSKKNLQKMLKMLQQGKKKKKKPTKPSARLEALVYMLTSMLKENVEARCERKVQRVHQKHLTLNVQNKQRGKNNDKVMS
jgi:hypothetical protein